MRLMCSLLGHRQSLTYTLEACVLRCLRCGHEDQVGTTLRPEVRHRAAREARRREIEDARIVARREAMAAEMAARSKRSLKLVRQG